MPGPKMGPRPADFDEEVVRQSPTFLRWLKLENGQKLRYACRDFVKGKGDDEERLMRRIMIARRNNLRDHETLKRARQTSRTAENDAAAAEEEPSQKKEKKTRRSNPGGSLSDAQVAREMDVPAVEATRSYRQWVALEDGKEFVYNQKYIKGKEGHDWLLRKNIWRRMRYRRENKKMVERLKGVAPTQDVAAADRADSDMTAAAATHIVDHALLASAAAAATTTSSTEASNVDKSQDASGSHEFVPTAVVEAAVAAAECYVKEQTTSEEAAAVDSSLSSTIAAMSVPSANELRVHNPLDAAASNEALDAAAKLAAAAVPPSLQEDGQKETEMVLEEEKEAPAPPDPAIAIV